MRAHGQQTTDNGHAYGQWTTKTAPTFGESEVT